MATFGKSIPLFFLLLVLIFSVDQTLARESRFFSKVTRSEPASDNTKSPEAQQVVNVEAKEEEEEPTFLPQTSENGAPYGLYARRPAGADFSPSQTTTTTTTKKFSQQQPQKEDNTYFNNVETFDTVEESTTTAEPESNNYGSRKNYAAELQGIGGYTKRHAGNGYDDVNYYNNKRGGSYFGGEKQGLSDTRFMENGRYFHDVQNEKKPAYYNSGEYQSKNVGRTPEYYNRDGLYSGGAEGFNNYYNKNARTGFQQQQQEEEEFEFDP